MKISITTKLIILGIIFILICYLYINYLYIIQDLTNKCIYSLLTSIFTILFAIICDLLLIFIKPRTAYAMTDEKAEQNPSPGDIMDDGFKNNNSHDFSKLPQGQVNKFEDDEWALKCTHNTRIANTGLTAGALAYGSAETFRGDQTLGSFIITGATIVGLKIDESLKDSEDTLKERIKSKEEGKEEE